MSIKNFISRLQKKVYYKGWHGLFLIIIQKLTIYPFLQIVQIVLGYDRWHNTPFFIRPYAKKIVEYLNKKDTKNSVVEIGCGTGDILRRLLYNEKYGLDNDEKVLKGLDFFSVFLNKSTKIKILVFDFEKEELEGQYDIIILCNWIHGIRPELLKEKINKIFDSNLKLNGEIIVDVIKKNSNYPYNHDISYLTSGFFGHIKEIGNYDYGRIIYSIKKSI